METNSLIEKVSTTSRKLPDYKVSDKYAGLKVVGLVADNGACGHYRVINPLHMLKMHGADVVYGTSQNLNQFIHADVIIAPRQNSPEAYEMFRTLQWDGKIIVFEVDDDLHKVLKTSPAYTAYYPGSDTLKWLEKFMENCHGLTVTTEELAGAYSEFNTNYAILPNYIDFSFRDWKVNVSWQDGEPFFEPIKIKKPDRWKDKVVIQWSGGSSHLTDLEQIMVPISRILQKYPETIFAYYGAPDIFNHLNKDNIIPEGRYELVEPRHFMDHPTGLFGADIGLAPVHPCEFNISKSPLKLLEGFAAGQAMIASNVAPYSKLQRKHPESVLIVGSGEGNYSTWFSALEELVTNTVRREKMQKENRELAINEYSLENNFHKWPYAWKDIIDRAQKGKLGPNKKISGRVWGQVDRNALCPCGSGLKYKKCCRESHG